LRVKKKFDMLSKDQFLALMYPKYEAWATAQSTSTDGFEYEETFEAMLHDLGHELLQGTASSDTDGMAKSVSEREKKKSKRYVE
jgi:hypothetical protein